MRLVPKQIERYLKEPYPYYYNDQKRVVLVLFFLSVLSFSFSFFFEPFEVNVTEHKINTIWILLIHACIPFPVAYTYIYLINRNIKESATWTLGKEILNLSMILLIIGIADFLIRDLIYTNLDNWSLRYFWEEIRNTFLVGTLLLTIVLPLNLERLIHKHTASLKRLSLVATKEASRVLISIKSAIPNENFELKDFLFAKVESNYTEVFTSSLVGVDKTLIRITLKELEKQLTSFPHIYKTHRSYLVNLNAIESISGNAQGYQLILKNCSILVPVSRSKVSEFNAVYSKK